MARAAAAAKPRPVRHAAPAKPRATRAAPAAPAKPRTAPRRAPSQPRRRSGPAAPARGPAPAPRKPAGNRPDARPRGSAPAAAPRKPITTEWLASALAARGNLLLDRLLRGRLWVGFIGALLAGIVFLNVGLLQLNDQIARTDKRSGAIGRENAALRIKLARLDSTERIQRLAAAKGFVMPAPGAVRYVRSKPGDGRAAARGIVAPEPRTAAAPAQPAQPVVPTTPTTPTQGVTPQTPAPTQAVTPTTPAPTAAAPAATAQVP